MSTPKVDNSGTAGQLGRRRNSAESQQALFDAARELFAERGFERTTTREIGERAGLDPTLIARYFGSKTELYMRVLRSDFDEQSSGAPADLLEPGRMAEVLDRISRRGPGPILDAVVRPHHDPQVRAESLDIATERVVDPLRRRFEREGTPDPELRAEILVAAFVGVAISRYTGAFPRLSAAPAEDIAPLLRAALEHLTTAG